MNIESHKSLLQPKDTFSTPQHDLHRDVSFSALFKDMFSVQPNDKPPVQKRIEKIGNSPYNRPTIFNAQRVKSKSPNRLQFRGSRGTSKVVMENRSASSFLQPKPVQASFKKNQFINCVINFNKFPKPPALPVSFAKISSSYRKIRVFK